MHQSADTGQNSDWGISDFRIIDRIPYKQKF